MGPDYYVILSDNYGHTILLYSFTQNISLVWSVGNQLDQFIHLGYSYI